MSFFRSPQSDYFTQSCKKRFEWQNTNLFVAEAERDLLRYLQISQGSKVLELGSGTGSNLENLREPGLLFSFIGIDINEAEIRFSRERFPEDRFIVGDATNVALPGGKFDVVFCRDLLHHVDVSKQKTVIEEMARVAKPGGRVVVIESNGRNFLIKIFGRLVKSEHHVLQSVPDRIETLIRGVAGLDMVDQNPQYAEPSNLFRLLLHYHLGLPWLAKSALIRLVLRWFNQLVALAVSPDRWAYMIFTAVKRR